MANLYFVCTLLLAGASQLTAFNETEINLNGTFDEQVAEIMRHRQPHEKNLEAVYKALADVNMVMRTLWPDAKIAPFGSRFTGVGTAESDIDCMVSIPSNEGTNYSLLVENAADTLALYPDLFTQVKDVGRARIPIVQTVHLPTKLDVDLSFSGASSVSNTKLLNYFFHLDDRILKLAVIIKYWETLQELEDNKTPSSYTSMLMVIFFLQQKLMLPPVVELQKNIEPIMDDYWNIAFKTITYRPSSDLTLFDLLVGYFEYYANFAYNKYVISPFMGYPVHRVKFINYQTLPEEYGLYKFNMEKNLTRPLLLKRDIVVQEPFEHGRNLATGLFHRYAQTTIAALKKANEIYETNRNPDKYLISIMRKL